jgi:thiol-disulfide isomerase/thioredoxin
MRLLACLIAITAVAAAVADEPQKNPFRDGTGRESVAPKKAAPLKDPPRVLRAADAGVGRLVGDAAFTDLAGKPGKLSDFKDSKLLVVALTNTSCPLCKKYAPTLARLEKEYSSKGVAFLFVNPTATDKADATAFAGRYVHDTKHALTAAFGSKTTTEVFVLDAARTVVYRGAIDDQFGLGYSLDAPRNTYLTAALNDLLAGKQPVTAATTAPGCDIALDSLAAPTPLTYHARVERIVQNNCVECHRAGGVAPFELTTYEQVVAHRGMIRKVVDRGTMPPWFAAPPEKGHDTLWANDRSLPEADKTDLLAWLAGDLKKGDPADAPLPRSFATGWAIGKPDAVFELPKPIAVKAQGTMPYQNVTVPTDFDDDRWVRAVEVQPTAREVVHHVLVFAVPKGMPRVVGEGQGFFAVYVPGNNTLIYPDGYAKKLPKGASLHFQIHYTPNGTATTDRTRIGLVFAAGPPRHEVRVAGLVNARFSIPPGAEDHKIEARLPVPFDARVLAFFPHAHLRGKAARYEVRVPDGTTKTLLDVPHYDFNWQLTYRYAEPAAVPRGSSLVYTAWYDNSDKNPANPDPKRTVRWGPQTFDEMHLGYVEYVIDRDAAARPRVRILTPGRGPPAPSRGFP